MGTYRRRTRVAAPLDEVWSFHSRVSGLEELTPGFMDLRVEAVVGPDGEPDPEILERGATIRMSIRPFGIGPRQSWTSRIVEREERDGSAYFRDEMEDGPFPEWEHTHRFYGDGAGTVIVDEVRYRLPGGPLGGLAEPFGDVGFEPMFRGRHRKTKELLGRP
ncbi:SRPBCC family protein [Candidatus Halobonum tyrrellensis]|uniref:Cyclase/dehydrase n=1 Tax=Candidatus Halobonum tyrrellensis G22 TaxID=1324957 RepID=V4H950_9EURY|nr:SRPBCC family protein [Candidatus Halobonum tyrrellensis]ESP87240.1 cyclase/dehydrase [Candidatus Halobonum tyrrellensis G22]